MPLMYSEEDLRVVGKIQEMRNCTIDHAKSIYRGHVQKLANQDAPNRAELVLEAINRITTVASDDEVEAAVAAPKKAKMTKNERRLARKEAKTKSPQKATMKPAEPRVEVTLAPLEREVELVPIADNSHVYTANLFGKKHAVIWGEINRTQGAHQRFQAVTMNNKRMEAVKAYAKESDLPIAYCVTVRVLGKLDQGYAVPIAVFQKFKQSQGPNVGFSLSRKARAAYREHGWDGVKFIEKAAESKAA